MLATPMARPADPAVRAALLDAAAARLAEGGVQAVSVRGIAADVGTSTQAVYTYFGSKDDLLRAIVEEAFSRLAQELGSVAHTDDPLTDLIEAGWAYRRNALANPNLYRVMFERNPLHLGSPVDGELPPFDAGIDAFTHLEGLAARAVEVGAAEGPADRLALSLWSAAHGAVSLELAGFFGADGAEVFAATCLGVTAGAAPT